MLVSISSLFPPFCFVCIREKVESCKSPAPIEAAVYGVRWAHVLAGVSSPTDSSMVKQMLEAVKRLLDVDVIVKVAEKFNTPRASVSDLRTCFIFDGNEHGIF